MRNEHVNLMLCGITVGKSTLGDAIDLLGTGTITLGQHPDGGMIWVIEKYIFLYVTGFRYQGKKLLRRNLVLEEINLFYRNNSDPQYKLVKREKRKFKLSFLGVELGCHKQHAKNVLSVMNIGKINISNDRLFLVFPYQKTEACFEFKDDKLVRIGISCQTAF